MTNRRRKTIQEPVAMGPAESPAPSQKALIKKLEQADIQRGVILAQQLSHPGLLLNMLPVIDAGVANLLTAELVYLEDLALEEPPPVLEPPPVDESEEMVWWRRLALAEIAAVKARRSK